LEACESVERAVQGADIVVTATTSVEPILRREWLAAGVHINAVGSFQPGKREIDSATMAACKLFVDRRESTLNESGDYFLAAKDGAIGPDHIVAEIGELVVGSKTFARAAADLTLFNSLGMALEDVAAAHHVYQAAVQTRAGTRLAFGPGDH
jgi:ornithine cyclodeaminase